MLTSYSFLTDPEYLLIVVNILFINGSIKLLHKTWKVRKTITDYDLYGSSLTFIALTINCIAFLILAMPKVVILSIPTLLLWLLISYFTAIKSHKDYTHENKST